MVEDEMLTCMYPRFLEQFAEKVIMWGLLCSFKVTDSFAKFARQAM
jgi:hypothetical protein